MGEFTENKLKTEMRGKQRRRPEGEQQVVARNRAKFERKTSEQDVVLYLQP